MCCFWLRLDQCEAVFSASIYSLLKKFRVKSSDRLDAIIGHHTNLDILFIERLPGVTVFNFLVSNLERVSDKHRTFSSIRERTLFLHFLTFQIPI